MTDIARVERQMLGGLLLQGEYFGEVHSLLKSPKLLTEELHRVIYDAMFEVYFTDNEKIDLVSVSAKDRRRIDPVTLSDMTAEAVSGSRSPDYAKMILATNINLGMYHLAKEIERKTKDGMEDPLDLLESVSSNVEQIYGLIPQKSSLSSNEVADQAVKLIESIEDPTSPTLKTGFADVDDVIGGIIPKELIIVGGKRKSGKSTFAFQTLYHNVERLGIPAAVFTREMTPAQIYLRKAMIDSKVSYTDVVSRRMSPDQRSGLMREIERIKSLPVVFNDAASGIADIIYEVRSLRRKKGIQLVVLDYIQITDGFADSRREGREQEIASISRALKKLAAELDIPVIALSQLNEDNKSRESRAIEQDCDKLIYIKSPDEEDEKGEEDDKGRMVELKIVQRFGLSGHFGDIKLYYDKRYGAFKDSASRVEVQQSVGNIEQALQQESLPF